MYQYRGILHSFGRDRHPYFTLFFRGLNNGDGSSPECVGGKRTEAFHVIIGSISTGNNGSLATACYLDGQGRIGNYISVFVYQLYLHVREVVLAGFDGIPVGSQTYGGSPAVFNMNSSLPFEFTAFRMPGS